MLYSGQRTIWRPVFFNIKGILLLITCWATQKPTFPTQNSKVSFMKDKLTCCLWAVIKSVIPRGVLINQYSRNNHSPRYSFLPAVVFCFSAHLLPIMPFNTNTLDVNDSPRLSGWPPCYCFSPFKKIIIIKIWHKWFSSSESTAVFTESLW